MRKNGVNKTLAPIDGGVCAPEGFRANGVRCGISTEERNTQKDLALILTDKRFPVACVFSENTLTGEYTKLSRANAQAGYVKALLLYNGREATLFAAEEKRSEKELFRALAKQAVCDEKEILILPVGKADRDVSASLAEKSLRELAQGAGSDGEHALLFAETLADNAEVVKQKAYAFFLGDVSCKIGAAFRGGSIHASFPQSTVCCLTTDVNITPEMLKKAFFSSVNYTLGMLDLGVSSSPNDFTVIMASGKAGNYTISVADTEYKKFADTLKRVLYDICFELAKNSEGNKRLLCTVEGARSTRIAQGIAKAVVRSERVKAGIRAERADVEGILCAMGEAGEELDLENAAIEVYSEMGKVVIWDLGTATAVAQGRTARIFTAQDIYIRISLHTGNYGAKAIGRA